MAAAMSTAIGPILGGVLTDSLGWRYIFWLNAPVGVAVLLMTYRYLPESCDSDAASIDVPGQTLAMVGLGTLTVVLVEQNTARALDVADKVCVMSSGVQVYQGTAAEAKAAGSLFATFLGMNEPIQQ